MRLRKRGNHRALEERHKPVPRDWLGIAAADYYVLFEPFAVANDHEPDLPSNRQ